MTSSDPATPLPAVILRRRLGLILLPLIAAVWMLLAAHSLSVGGVTWDELFDFEGVNGAFWHGINWLKGARPDLHTITFDLEYYGNATRWPTYLLWRLLMTFPWESISTSTLSRTQIVLLSNYVALNHLNAMVFALLGIGLAGGLGVRLGGRRAGLLAAGLLLLLPTWLGHGWMNSKDIPMAASYLLYSLGSTLLLQGQKQGAPLRLLGIGLMTGSRVSSVAFLAVGEALLSPWLGRRAPWPWLASLAGGLLLGFLLTPQAWGDPFGYPLEAIRFITERQALSTPLQTLQYLATNLIDLLPSPLLLGLLLLLLSLPGRGGLPPLQQLVPLLPLLLQLLIPPTLLVLTGKSVYNELRHLLMIQPPLCILAGLGYARALGGLGPARPLRHLLLLLAAAASAVLVIEMLLLSPYQYSYRSDLVRLVEAGRTAPLRTDYWGFSTRETFRRCLKQQPCADRLARLPVAVDGYTFNPDLIAAFTGLLRPEPPADQPERLLISTDPATLGRFETLASSQRPTLLPWPRRGTLSALVLDPGNSGATS